MHSTRTLDEAGDAPRIEDVIAHLPVPVATARVRNTSTGSAGWEIVSVNGAFAELFAVAPSAARGQDLRRFYHADFDAMPLDADQAAQPVRVEAETREPLGRSTQVLLTVAPAGRTPPCASSPPANWMPTRSHGRCAPRASSSGGWSTTAPT
ncbi:hypothetical protein GCM10025873_18280 [Demequina sediminis]|uniref:PAS domain-containing protein n=1 Tax=Demequina sediminis TaxID=1930058 RepID=UPI002572A88E|nr:PAS domain-containing protein [Demequina sediminis]BDZ62037.1 hypothetical protein GCM10025873_18280 [Demequina sediminis]